MLRDILPGEGGNHLHDLVHEHQPGCQLTRLIDRRQMAGFDAPVGEERHLEATAIVEVGRGRVLGARALQNVGRAVHGDGGEHLRGRHSAAEKRKAGKTKGTLKSHGHGLAPC